MARPVFARHDVMAALDGANGLDDLYGVFDANCYTAGRHKKRRSVLAGAGNGVQADALALPRGAHRAGSRRRMDHGSAPNSRSGAIS